MTITKFLEGPQIQKERENATLDYAPPQRRKQKACVLCNKRKIRCDLTDGAAPCTNCRDHKSTCIPHKRKRRHPTTNFLPALPILQTRFSDEQEPEITHGNPDLFKGFESPTSHHGSDGSPSFLEKNTFFSRDQSETLQYANLSEDRATATAATINRCGFIGHPELVAGDLETDDVSNRVPPPPRNSRSATDTTVLCLYGALDLPSRAIRDSLISNFVAYCDPWMPIIEASELKTLGLSATEFQTDGGSGSSLLLAQAVFVAGSRVHSPRFSFASCSEFYDRAKALFFAEHESNPLTIIRALCLLQWYNPSGPEFVSIHSSSFWLRTAVGLAFQIGLHREPDSRSADYGPRRRLFWTLYCRDCILSSAHGRPRAINLDDCNICWPTIHDFPLEKEKRARLFVAYVNICTILGRLGRASLPDGHLRSQRADIGGALFRWASQLPPELRLTSGADFDVEVRQLYLLYFTSISILHGPGPLGDSCSAASILASSCVARTFEDFLARDMLRYLSPTVPYFLLVAGLSQLACYRIPGLLEITKSEVAVIRSSLEELGKIWHSARQKLHILDRLLAVINSGSGNNDHIDQIKRLDISQDQLSYFQMLSPDLCPKWDLITLGHLAEQQQILRDDVLIGPTMRNEGRILLVPESQMPSESATSESATSVTVPTTKVRTVQREILSNGFAVSEVDWILPNMDGRGENFNDILESSGSWLLQGWGPNLL